MAQEEIRLKELFQNVLAEVERLTKQDGEGPGLFAYLRELQGSNGGDRRDVIAAVFRGTVNRMISGYLLLDLINKINSIHFTDPQCPPQRIRSSR